MISAVGLNNYATHDQSRFPELWRGCVGAWAPCLGPTGGRLFDFSRFNNWGTLTNMDNATDWVVSDGRYALDFDGVDDRVSISTPGQSNFCVSLWFRIRSFKAGTDGVIFTINNGANNNIYIAQRTGGANTLTCNGFDGTVKGIYNGGPSLTLNVWTHAVCIAANEVYQIYINGIKTSEVAAPIISSTANSITIGNYIDGLRPGDQLIDDCRLYNRALSLAEIRLLATRRGIAYEPARRRRIPQTVAAFNAGRLRRQSLIGSGVY